MSYACDGMSKEEHLIFLAKRKIIVKRFVTKWKARAFKIMGDKCVKCGFCDQRALQIDHINGHGSIKARNRNSSYYKIVTKSVEIGENEFQLLCANCNWIKRYENNENPFYHRKSGSPEYQNMSVKKYYIKPETAVAIN